MKQFLITAILFAFTAYSQQGPALTSAFFYSGSNLAYKCTALSNPKPSSPSTGSISAASNANPVSFTSAAHQFDLNAIPIVIISGATGGWTAINGTFAATITGANTFTIPVDSTAFGALSGTIVFSTFAPRLNQLVWSIAHYLYDGSNNLVGSYWAGDPTLNNATSNDMTKACSSRTTYAYQ